MKASLRGRVGLGVQRVRDVRVYRLRLTLGTKRRYRDSCELDHILMRISVIRVF